MKEILLHTNALAVGYPGRPVLQDVTFSLRAGEILTLIGPNGAGKSTLLKSIIRQLEPLGGTVFLKQRPMAEWSQGEMARTLSILMTERIHPELMTCEEVVSTGRYPYTGRLGILSPHDREQVARAMELVQITSLRERDFQCLSDGQRQRVLLARAICQEPQVLVLDEPTSFLDLNHKLELLNILKRLAREEKLAVILSLHELDLAQKISDRLLCLRDGGVDRCGTPEEIFSGGYLQHLYGMAQGSYNETFGCLELEPPRGIPRVLVLGGGGRGIPVYRKLQRLDIPFAAGILQEQDLDWPVARALACRVVTEQPFEPVGEAAVQEALKVLAGCDRLICCLETFGSINRRSEALVQAARKRGILIMARDFLAEA